MQVRIVRMLVQKPRVRVPVAVRLAGRRVGRMLVLVMDVMHVAMLMLERLMQMLMIMRLGEVQIDANAHQQRSADESKGRPLANSRSARAAPIKGADEKYAPVRAVPKCRRLSTKSTKLTP